MIFFYPLFRKYCNLILSRKVDTEFYVVGIFNDYFKMV